MSNVKLTMSQALIKWMINQTIIQFDGKPAKAFKGVWAIFGHGNVVGLGEALYKFRKEINTYRGHNEQGMAHAAIAFAKQMRRRQFMAVTSSIGPGATNMLTAAALAHVNRLPVLFLPGDVFADRRPDPVLQQLEDFSDGTVSANDCFRPISRYFDRITRPEQLLQSLPKAMSILTDPSNCGPVTLALCQDVQAEAYSYPLSFFEPKVWKIRRQAPDIEELDYTVSKITNSKKPLIIAGGGIHYSGATEILQRLVSKTGIPVASTQAGKSAMIENHPQYLGSIGVTGSSASNKIASEADLVLSIGSRLQDFTTGSNSLINGEIISLNIQLHDTTKHQSKSLICDAKTGLDIIEKKINTFKVSEIYRSNYSKYKQDSLEEIKQVTNKPNRNILPSDSQVIGAVNRNVPKNTIVVGAAGSMPGELHKLWLSEEIDGYHMEYGFSCMGYEISAGIGVNMAMGNRPNVVFAGDGSYLMMNSELATAVMLGISMTLVVTDNRGFGCINRLQKGTGNVEFNNLFKDTSYKIIPEIDFVSHAASMGARAFKADSIHHLEQLVSEAINKKGVDVIVIDTDPNPSTQAGGTWWDVAIPETSERKEVIENRESYIHSRKKQNKGEK